VCARFEMIDGEMRDNAKERERERGRERREGGRSRC